VERLAADTLTFEHAYAVVGSPLRSITYSCGHIDKVFELASVTKLLTAWSALIAIEERHIDFATPAGPAGATVRHLLAHTSGVPFEKGAILAKPGARRIYSNHGIELLGEVISAHTGLSINEWITAKVVRPLHMRSTTIDGSPAYSGQSSVADLALFAAEVLHPTLLSSQMALAARTVQFPGISGILPGYGRQTTNDWGMGFEIRDHKDPHWTGTSFSPRTCGHFGQSGSFLWIDPTIAKAGIFLGEQKFGDAHRRCWPALTDAMRDL